MNVPLEKFRQNILKIKDHATERSYYKDISNFIVEFAESEGRKDFFATPEESSTVIDREIGFPDITVRQGNRLVGWMEVKLPDDNLDSEKFQNQFKKYKDSLENILFTNLREWQLWQWDDKGNPIKEIDLLFDITSYNITEEEKFKDVLSKFFEGRPYEARTPKQLALALAKKTKLLSKQVEESFNEGNENSDLQKLKETFEKTLIQNISIHQFSNMVAETMAYSLFLAALEHTHRGNGVELTLTNAIDYLPTNVPILADLYSLIKKVSSTIPTIYKATQLLVDQLNYSDIERVHQKLVEHKPGEDPVIQFYEPFLNEYDPKEREARGVYYTPKPVVDYIVRSVDWLLRNKFNKAKGLADESVYLLDPATGTGTFLMSAIQEIHGDIKKENASFGDAMVKREFNRVVLSHILKHFYGFELLIAPYAIAHLKLTLEVERLGFDFALTKNDNDQDNDRFKVYLANTLDDPDKPPQNLFGFDSIPQESEKAREVKKNAPILAIIGNPPYSVSSSNMKIDFILNLIEDYKHGCGVEDEVRIAPIQDDYIKFIRFAQWKLDNLGYGILAFITNNSYLDGLIHRAMRKKLLNDFNEIYILNLHGNLKLGERAPDDSIDDNVFPNIQTGVSIAIFIKNIKKNINGKLFYSDLYGRRNYKYDYLLNNSLSTSSFIELKPKPDLYFFTNKDYSLDSEYEKYYSISKVFINYKLGVMTGKDNFVLDYEKAGLMDKLNDLVSNKTDLELRNKYQLEDSRDWKLRNARKIDLKVDRFNKILYRPFDRLDIYYDDNLFASPQRGINKHFLHKNIGLLISKQLGTTAKYTNWFVTNSITEMAVFKSAKSAARIAPLYLYNENSNKQLNFVTNENLRSPNLNQEFVKKFANKLILQYIVGGHGDLVKTFGPEDIFNYAYAIFHSPTYRSRYTEQLKIDFPRLPLTGNQKLFAILVKFGNELVDLHLLGENPFNESKTIFNESDKWNVKIGGEKPENLDDWKVNEVSYDLDKKRVYINAGQYFEGIGKEVWEFMIGGYQVCEKWLKDRKKAERTLSTDDLKHYMKIVVSLRETIRIMGEIDKVIDAHSGWPLK